MKETEFNSVSKPYHYNQGKIEPREVIRDWKLGFNLGNALKYIGRCEHKGSKIEDLKKARQYLDFEIEDTERKPR